MVTDGNTDASVKFANVVLQTLDSTFIIGVSTDTKGRFQLEKIETGSYRLIISAIGYTDNITDLNGLSKSVDLGKLTLNEAAEQLDEVTVTAANIVNRADRKIVFPNKQQLAASTNGVNLLQALMLPRIQVNPMTRDISVSGGGSVQLCLNGAKVDAKDISALQPNDIIRIEYLENYTTMSGEVRTVTTMKTVVPSGGQHPYIIGVSWDVTEIKKTEKELIAARIKAEEADRMKSSFLANMSHEIRTPLNAIVGFSKLIIEADNECEKRQYADIVEHNSTVLLNLFNDILDLSALEAGSLELSYHPVRLKDICLQLYELHVKSVKPEVRLVLDEVDSQLCIQGDWERISQILVNLITNAIKFTSVGEIHFGFQKKADMVQFYISDTGKGIPAERVATIFQRFGKIDDFVQGTGLGLTICRMLVEKMGGRIWVRSKQGKGTVFYFTLPMAK